MKTTRFSIKRKVLICLSIYPWIFLNVQIMILADYLLHGEEFIWIWTSPALKKLSDNSLVAFLLVTIHMIVLHFQENKADSGMESAKFKYLECQREKIYLALLKHQKKKRQLPKIGRSK